MNKIALSLGASLVLTASLCAEAAMSLHPQSDDSPWRTGKYLAGNWGGLRDQLEASGVDFFAYFATDPAGKVSGGKSKNFNYPDDFFLGVDLDLEKFTGWKGYSQFGRTEKTQNSYGFWIHADQMVYRLKPGNDLGLIIWAASGYYPQESISIIPFQVNSGLVYKGLIATRDDDREILGIIYGRFSRDYAENVRAVGAGDPRYELVLEGVHRFQLWKFAYLQPDLQFIVRPGGTEKIPNALVLGTQTE